MKKRILYIGNNLSHPSFTETYITFLSESLRSEGYSVKTASSKNNKILRLFEMLSLIFWQRKQADWVLIDTYGSWNFYYAYACAKLCDFLNLSYIPILHGGNLPTRLSSSRHLSKTIFGKAKLNIAPSQFLCEIFLSHGFKNTCVIPNSIQLGNYPFFQRQQFHPKLLWVRRFQKRYNPMLALESYKKLRLLFPEAALCMVGPEKDGSLEECKVYARKHGLPVVFSGKLEKKEWIYLSEHYDLFLSSTSIDNTPISVIEAMALGLPIISTNVGGVPFLVDHNQTGILVPQKNSDSIVEAVVYLLQEQKKAGEMALAARKKAEAFAWERVKNEWERHLNSSGSSAGEKVNRI